MSLVFNSSVTLAAAIRALFDQVADAGAVVPMCGGWRLPTA